MIWLAIALTAALAARSAGARPTRSTWFAMIASTLGIGLFAREHTRPQWSQP
ncbi:hypothetical protein [Kutzneria sp. 744]|uniref:hypothetical protein n=1 Tax=Kutzneria sp. (strain 744) TaxID=345341 RepID=UPI0004BB1B8E|nr:hypothetical protein [Kutzneria sp. 744]